MSNNGSLVLSRATVAVISLFPALPLVLLIVGHFFRTPLTDVYVAFVFGIFRRGGPILSAMLLLSPIFVETIYRWIKLVGYQRLPWFSFFLVPGFLLCFLAALAGAVMERLNALILAGFFLFMFQVVGQLSLVQLANDDSHLMVTQPDRR